MIQEGGTVDAVYSALVGESRAQEDKATLKENASLVFKAMEEMNIDVIEVDYDGGGDCGEFHGATAYTKTDDGSPWKPLDISWPSLLVSRRVSTFDDTGKWISSVEKRETLMDEVVAGMAQKLVYMHHPGWETNDGGRGNVYFYRNKTIKVDHEYYVIETESHTHEFEFSDAPV